jgi:WD40 repeat protein
MKNNIIHLILLIFFSQNILAQDLSVQTGHSSTILDLEYSPDGKMLVSSGMDNKIILWDLHSYRQMNILSGHNAPVSCVAFHPHQNIIASASDDQTVKLWEYPSGKLLKTFDIFTDKVKSVDFKPDGTEIACGSDSVYIINLKNDSVYTLKKKARRYFNSVKYSKNNDFLAFGGRKEFKLFVYNFKKERIFRRMTIHSNDIFFDDASKYVYSAGNNGNIKRLNIAVNRTNFNLPAERSWHSFLSIALHEKYIYGANKNGLIYVYNRKTGRRKATLKGHDGQVKAITVSPDGKYLASAGDDKKIVLWDAENKDVAKVISGGTGSINSISFNEEGNKMFIAYDNSDFRIWDLQNKGEIDFGQCPKPTYFEKKAGKSYFVSNTTNELKNDKILIKTSLKKADKRTDDFLRTFDNVLIYHTKTNSLPILLKSKKNTDFQSVLIADSSDILVFDNKSTHSQKYSILNWERIRDREEIFSTHVYKYNIDDVKKNSKINIQFKHRKNDFKIKDDIYYKTISSDGQDLLVLINERKNKSRCEIYNIKTGKKQNTIEFNQRFATAGFSNTGNYLYFVKNSSDSIYFYKRSNAEIEKKLKGCGPLSFMYDDRYCSYTDLDKNLYLIDLIQFKPLYSVPTRHITAVSDIQFNKKYNYIATSGYDGIINFWNFDDGAHLVSLAAFNKDDYMYVTHENYYHTTFGSMDYINFLMNEKLYTFEQFDVLYNRPDIVLSKLPYSTAAEIAAYNKAYQKRITKMGYTSDETEKIFSIPSLNILNADEFHVSTINNEIKIKISAQDTLYYLNRVNIWVNDVPIFGIHGNEITEKHAYEFIKEYPINLSPGNNKIQVSVTNEAGFESLKETFYIHYDAEKTIPDLYVVSIGVSKYVQNENNLEFAAKDADDMVNLLQTGQKKYNKIYTKLLTDSLATKDNILAAKNFLKKSTINDVVLVFYAGHGLLDWDMDYYVATNDMDFIFPSEKGLNYDLLESLLNDIPARKKMLFIDACHSGEVDKDETADEQTLISDTSNNDSSRGTEELGDKKILSQSSFELMKHMFADIRKGTGSTIISSAGGSEYAYESDKTKNGIFTYILINGLSTGKADFNKDGKIMVSELRDYLMENVSKLTQGYQNPTCRRQNLEFDFRVW